MIRNRYIVERKQMQTYQIVAVMLYIITPFLAAVLTVTVYGLSVSNAIVMLTLLLMYCILNVSQGREKAAADRDLAVASSIQENILPRIFPYLPEREEFDLYATMTPGTLIKNQAQAMNILRSAERGMISCFW